MEKELFEYTAERAEILSKADSSKQETREAAQAWLDAVTGADDAKVQEETEKLLNFLEGRPSTIDGLIAFASGPAIELMGAEAAAGMLAAAKAHKEQGGKYCICEACTAASEILAKHGRIQL